MSAPRSAVALLVRLFFRRLEVVGRENVPADRGGVLVAWHPNGLVDPALILATFPREVVFGARSGLFRIPLLGTLMRALGTVPIHRREDAAEAAGTEAGTEAGRRARNEASLDALADRIVGGAFSALFPEGMSHDAPSLRELKTGAARLYYRARSRTPAGRPPPVVLPVGLHYDHKRLFRSSVLVVFHPSLTLPPELDRTPSPDGDLAPIRELARALTARVREELGEVVLETESWDLHHLFHRARKLVRAERASRAGSHPGGATMEEKVLGLARVRAGYHARSRSDPEAVRALRRRVERYDKDLRTLGVEDHELDQPPPVFRPWLWLILASQVLAVSLLLPPFLVIGWIVNLPPALMVSAMANAVGKEGKDVASLKLIGGVVAFPAAWALWAGVAAWASADPGARALAPWLPGSPLLAGAVALVLGAAGGFVMLVYVGLARATWRALRVRLTRGRRARTFLRLRVERGRLCDALLEEASGLDLPGVVQGDGTVRRDVQRTGMDPAGR